MSINVTGVDITVDCDDVDEDLHLEDLPQEGAFVQELFATLGDNTQELSFAGFQNNSTLTRN